MCCNVYMVSKLADLNGEAKMNLNQIINILNCDGLDEALSSLCQVQGHDRELRLYAVWCARQVQKLMADQRSINALNVAERFATGFATENELASAHVAAEAAASDAADATARATQWVTSWNASQDAGLAAALAAASCVAAAPMARDVACFAVGAAAGAAGTELDAQDAASDAARAKQELRLREVCAEIESDIA